jgi:hypothetical protein
MPIKLSIVKVKLELKILGSVNNSAASTTQTP